MRNNTGVGLWNIMGTKEREKNVPLPEETGDSVSRPIVAHTVHFQTQVQSKETRSHV